VVYIVKRALIATAVWWAAFLLSILVFGLIYHFAIVPPPAVQIEAPLHFAFPPTPLRTQHHQQHQQHHQHLHHQHHATTKLSESGGGGGSLSQASPVELGGLGRSALESRHWSHHYGPYARGCLSPFGEGQTYDYAVSLTLPESPLNYNVGVFMTRLVLFSSESAMTNLTKTHTAPLALLTLDEVLDIPGVSAAGERSLVLRWKSPLVRQLWTWAFALPMALGLGWFEERQTLETTILHAEAFVPPRGSDYNKPSVLPPQESPEAQRTQCFALLLNSPALQLYDAHIYVDANIGGLRSALSSLFFFFLVCPLLLSSLDLSCLSTASFTLLVLSVHCSLSALRFSSFNFTSSKVLSVLLGVGITVITTRGRVGRWGLW